MSELLYYKTLCLSLCLSLLGGWLIRCARICLCFLNCLWHEFIELVLNSIKFDYALNVIIDALFLGYIWGVLVNQMCYNLPVFFQSCQELGILVIKTENCILKYVWKIISAERLKYLLDSGESIWNFRLEYLYLLQISACFGKKVTCELFSVWEILILFIEIQEKKKEKKGRPSLWEFFWRF